MTSVRRAAGTALPPARHATDHTTEGVRMLLIHEALARSHEQDRQREAEEVRRALRLAAYRRWQRRAEAAGRRARALADVR